MSETSHDQSADKKGNAIIFFLELAPVCVHKQMWPSDTFIFTFWIIAIEELIKSSIDIILFFWKSKSK
jgi:hypothetical protein